MLCHTRFTIVRRRHHCRICGRVCCHPCSDEKYDDVAKIRRFGFDTPVRSTIDRIEPRADRRCVLATAALPCSPQPAACFPPAGSAARSVGLSVLRSDALLSQRRQSVRTAQVRVCMQCRGYLDAGEA